MKNSKISGVVEFLLSFSLLYSLLLTFELIWREEFSRWHVSILIGCLITTLLGSFVLKKFRSDRSE